ncbi:hypothetical protein ACLOJK_022792 [Asimina triloba]
MDGQQQQPPVIRRRSTANPAVAVRLFAPVSSPIGQKHFAPFHSPRLATITAKMGKQPSTVLH